MATFCRGKPLQLHTVIGDQFLVSGHDALAGLKCHANPVARWFEPTCQFHDYVNVRTQYRFGILSPFQTLWRPVDAFSRDIPVKDVSQFQPFRSDSNRIRATELPTVPKPNKATRSGRVMREAWAGSFFCTSLEVSICAIEPF